MDCEVHQIYGSSQQVTFDLDQFETLSENEHRCLAFSSFGAFCTGQCTAIA